MIKTIPFLAAALCAIAISASAQLGPPDLMTNTPAIPFGQRGGDGRGFGNNGAAFDFQGNNTGITFVKTLLHATDEEWKVINPLIQAVVTARTTVNYSVSGTQGFGGFGGPRGPGGFGPGGENSFAGPGMRGGFGRGGRGGFGRGGPGSGDSFADPENSRGDGPGGFGPDGFGPGGFGGPPDAAGPRGRAGGFAGPGPAGDNATNSASASPDLRGPNSGFVIGPPGPGFPGMDGANNAVAAAVMSLRTALASTNTTPDVVKEKLQAVTFARQRAKADLAAAQQRLRQVLTEDQQSALTALGYLD